MENMPDDERLEAAMENQFLAELAAIRRMIRDGLDISDDERDDIFVGSNHSSDDDSDNGSDDGSGMLESEAHRLAADREHLRLLHELHPHLPLHRRTIDLSHDHAAGAAADTAALDLRPLAEGDESRDYSERFKCCGCLDSKALDDFVVADCGHAVLCRECWAQNQQTERRNV
jgi:hypothetical protein